jgi:hypothetical protein
MINYRLLRDNKETGPYSEEEMIAKGFKPYDLLWAEGKSAGWQYPSEIPAFKNYAPIIEEQPYDRFYKKQPPQKLASEEGYSSRNYTPLPAKPIEVNTPQQQPAIPAYEYNLKTLPGRNIHVTLPSGNRINLTTLVAKKESRELKDAAETSNGTLNGNTILNSNQERSLNNNEKKQSSFNGNQPAVKKINPAEAEPVYNRIQNTQIDYANMQPVYAAQQNEYSWSLILGAVLGIATLVGLGIMIGLSMNRQKNDNAITEALNNRPKQSPLTQQQVTTQQTIKSEAITTTAIPATVSNVPVSKYAEQFKKKELVQNAVVKTEVRPATIGSEKDKKQTATDKSVLTEKNKPSQDLEVKETTVQHIKPLTNDALLGIEKVLSISPNEFKTGAFGGISGLKCTLFNGSKLPLESVIVELDYVQANNKVYKTERIHFKDISAGSQVTIDAPASPRGVKIISRIIKVNARDAALSNTTAKK